MSWWFLLEFRNCICKQKWIYWFTLLLHFSVVSTLRLTNFLSYFSYWYWAPEMSLADEVKKARLMRQYAGSRGDLSLEDRREPPASSNSRRHSTFIGSSKHKKVCPIETCNSLKKVINQRILRIILTRKVCCFRWLKDVGAEERRQYLGLEASWGRDSEW